MLNWIWLGMIFIAMIVGGFGGRLEPMTTGVFEQAEYAVMKVALPFIGAWGVWLGMMRLAERAGLVQALARVVRPVMTRLFPDVPPDHPAMGAMVLSVAANMLGAGNAATPLGLRAMGHLNRLNGRPGVASNAMVTFLVMCTASIQLLPTTAITVLALNAMKNKTPGSDATSIVAPALIATICALGVGLFLAKWLATWRMFTPTDDPGAEAAISDVKSEELAVEAIRPTPLTGRGRVMLWFYGLSFVGMFALAVWPDSANHLLQSIREHGPWSLPGTWTFADAWPGSPPTTVGGVTVRIIRAISLLAIPLMLSFFPLYAALRGVKVYEQFCEGAKEAFSTAQRVIPYLVAMLLAMRLLKDSGVMDMVKWTLEPALKPLHFPAELVPLALMRPLSGGASLGIMTDLVSVHGAHSLIGRMGATIFGSTETTFYVIAIYFGSVGVKKPRHAVIAGLAADFTALVVSVTACNLLLS